MLTSAVEDGSSVSHLVAAQPCDVFDLETVQHVPVMSMVGGGADLLACSSATTAADSELVRQLSLSTDDVPATATTLPARPHQQRVALVQPTVAPPRSVESRLLVHQPHSTPSQVSHQTQLTLSAAGSQTAVLAGSTAPRQIVITTQAPVQAQHVPQISLEQLQQVVSTLISLARPHITATVVSIVHIVLLNTQTRNLPVINYVNWKK